MKPAQRNNAEFWYQFVVEAEWRLKEAGLESAGLADGDRALPFCHYASLRNEAYVPVDNEMWRPGMRPELKRQLAYPPNSAGWNAAGHEVKFQDTIALLQKNYETHPVVGTSTTASAGGLAACGCGRGC